MSTLTGAQSVIQQLAVRGVRYIFGVPGGGCSLDIIHAAGEAGITFVVTRTENSAAMMAAAMAEVAGGIGVVLTTRGPGLANGVNGVAYASLDRAPIVLISDGYENDQAYISHQRFDQTGVLAPLVKGALRLDDPAVLPAVGALLDLAMAEPPGPVYLEVTGRGLQGTVAASAAIVQPTPRVIAAPSPEALQAAGDALAAARRPVIVAGLQAASVAASTALRALAARWNCPVLATYKAKGVLADDDPLMLGSYIGGAAEAPVLQQADLVLLFGVDPVEFPPQPWRYDLPVVQLVTHAVDRHYFAPVVSVIGDLAQAGSHLSEHLAPSAWQTSELARLKTHIFDCAQVGAETGGPITPQWLSQKVCAAIPKNARITVDAGAHMLSVLAWFQAQNPQDSLISRGLATMSFALPAAIGAALADPQRPVVAFTGDGGLMMCVTELASVVQAGCRLTVVVFNDSALTLIGVKQRRRGLPHAGVDYSSVDFARVARGLGCRGFRVEGSEALDAALAQAFDGAGPSVVDGVIDPEPYHAQIKAVRG